MENRLVKGAGTAKCLDSAQGRNLCNKTRFFPIDLFDRRILCTSGHEERSMPSSGTAHSGKVGSVAQSLID